LLLYYITDRTQFAGTEAQRRSRLLEKIAEAARFGVNYIQLREKDLPIRELEALARDAMQVIAQNALPSGPPAARLLINSRTDVALAAAADGVHLRSDDLSPFEVRKIWTQCGAGAPAREMQTPLIFVSCHAANEAARADQEGADFAVIAPVFEKRESHNQPSLGLEGLRQACRHRISVLALGGITLQNASACLTAGAAGIAAIRLFQENEIEEVVCSLRGTPMCWRLESNHA
jgi:thiamine-phosphate pyrophosphorylase